MKFTVVPRKQNSKYRSTICIECKGKITYLHFEKMFGEKEAPLFNRLVRLLKEVLQPLETGLSDSYVRYVLRTYRVQQRNLRALNKSGAVV